MSTSEPDRGELPKPIRVFAIPPDGTSEIPADEHLGGRVSPEEKVDSPLDIGAF